jgi:catechol 2,3-dioxygenase-like lactoylglutathione lyase family enzyme
MGDDAGAWRLCGVHHVGLTVGDIERSVGFYRDLLGLTLIRRRSAAAPYLEQQTGFRGVHLEVASFQPIAAGGPGLELVQYVSHPAEPADSATNRAGNSHVCFRVDDIAQAYECLRAQGVRFRSAPVAITTGPNQGGFVVYLSDPDGYIVELFQPPTAAIEPGVAAWPDGATAAPHNG